MRALQRFFSWIGTTIFGPLFPWPEYMIEGEEIRYRERPQRALYLMRLWAVIPGIVLMTWAVSQIRGWEQWLAFGGLVLLLIETFVEVGHWLKTWYVLTNYRAMRFGGLLRSDCEWLAWSKVNEVSVQRSAIDRWADTASIEIHAANADSSFRELTDLPDPLGFLNIVEELVARSRDR